MVLAVSSAVALQDLHTDKSHSGDTRWYMWLMGKRFPKQIEDHPHCHYTEMDANQEILPHFHQVNQFLVMVGGSVTVEGKDIPLILVHYSDRFTPFGPMSSGPYGLGIWALMPKSDPGGIYMSQPNAQARLKPSKRRSILMGNIAVSTPFVLQGSAVVALDNLLPKDADTSDGLSAHMLRMGARAKTTGPDPRVTGGQYYLVMNGSLNYNQANYAASSAFYLEPTDAPLEAQAGAEGVEALVMSFPRMEA